MKYLLRVLVFAALANYCIADNIVYVRVHRPVIEGHLKLGRDYGKGDRIRTLRNLFEKAGCPQVIEQSVPKEEFPNLICLLPGEEEGTIVVGASLDYPSEDDAAPARWGTLALLPLMAESLTSVPHRFTLMFVAFTGHESGVRGATWYVSQLSESQRKSIRAMIDLDNLGKTPPVYALGQSDKTLATWLQVAAHSLQIANPALVDASTPDVQLQNGAPAMKDEDLWANTKPFVHERIPAVTIQSAKPSMLSVLRRQGAVPDRVTGAGFDMDAYEDTYRLLCVYALYLDRNLGRPMVEPGIYTGKIIDTAGLFSTSPVELQVKIDRFTTTGELNRYELILNKEGQDGLAEALANESTKGTYRFGLDLAIGVKLIVLQNRDKNPYVLVVGTRLPPRASTSHDYRFTAIKLNLDGKGSGDGLYYGSVKLRFNRKHELEIDDFGFKPDGIRQVRLEQPSLPRTTPATAVAVATAPGGAPGAPPPAAAAPAAEATQASSGTSGAASPAAAANVSQDASTAKATAAAADTSTVATFRTKAQLVQLDVAVTDGKGKPVLGLQESDFTVLEDGKPQQIRVFEAHQPSAPQAAPATQVSLPPHTYTNQVTVASDVPLSILLLDLWNTSVTDQAFARKQTIEYLKGLPKGKTLAMFVMGGNRLAMVQGFTDDRSALLASAEKVLNERSLLLTTEGERQSFQGNADAVGRFARPAVPVGADPQSISNINSGGGMDIGFAQARTRTNAIAEANRTADRLIATLDSLSALARAVSSYPGRKNLVWLSGSFPVRLRPIGNDVMRMNVGSTSPTTGLEVTPTFLAALRTTTTALAEARIAVYPIDVRGNLTTGVDISVGAAESASFTGSDNPGAYKDNLTTQAGARFEDRSAMREVAEQTGGQVLAGNDVRGSIGRAIDDGSTYYAVAYTPAKNDTSQEFRKIEVKLKRPGLKLAYRPGYYPNTKPEATAPKSHPLIIAMQPGVPPSTVIPLTVEVLPPDNTSKKIRIKYTIDIRGIDFADTAQNGKRAVFDCIAVAFTRQGVPVGQISNTMDATLPMADYESALKNGFNVRQELELPAGEYNLRLGVMDRGSQKIGTLDAPMELAASK